jgi:hypothetical protein
MDVRIVKRSWLDDVNTVMGIFIAVTIGIGLSDLLF